MFVSSEVACSRQMLSDDIRRAVSWAGCDISRFSGISARKGGISTALEAGVSEAVLYLQSGHGQAKPGRRYMHILHPRLLLQTFEAFGL